MQAVQLETKFSESKTEAIRLQLQNEEHLVKLRHHEQAMLLPALRGSDILHLLLTPYISQEAACLNLRHGSWFWAQ